MTIELKGAVYPVSLNALIAFTQIINIIVFSKHAADLNGKLMDADRKTTQNELSGFFQWSFSDHCFTLRQRVKYRSEQLFAGNILEIRYGEIKEENIPGTNTKS